VGCVGAWRCGRFGGVGSLLTFDIPQTALVATLDTYDFIIIIIVLQIDVGSEKCYKKVNKNKIGAVYQQAAYFKSLYHLCPRK
jgi:hypothetical protein